MLTPNFGEIHAASILKRTKREVVFNIKISMRWVVGGCGGGEELLSVGKISKITLFLRRNTIEHIVRRWGAEVEHGHFHYSKLMLVETGTFR